MEYEVTISQTNTGLQSNADATLVLVKSDEYKKYNYVVAADNYDQAVKDKKILKNAIDKAKRTRIDFENKIRDEWAPIKDTLMKAEKIVEGYKDALDAGVKTVDEQTKEEKRKKIHSYYIENLNELQIPFDKVLDTKWLNKSCKQKQWQEGVIKKIADYELEYSLLERSDVEDKELLKSIFMDVWDRMESFAIYDAQMAAKKRAEDLRKKKEEQLKKVPPITTCGVHNDIPSMPIKKDKAVNKMVCIKGSQANYDKVLNYAVELGLSWEEL